MQTIMNTNAQITQMANVQSDGEYSANIHEGSSSLSSLELEQINDEPFDEENEEYQENLIQFNHNKK